MPPEREKKGKAIGGIITGIRKGIEEAELNAGNGTYSREGNQDTK